MKRQSQRYVLDPLYGVFRPPDYFWDIMTTPEVQRLREIRLCNINSLLLTGAANVNRFEHAIGTYILASTCLNAWPLDGMSETNRTAFLLAALLHDIANAAFGHSIEYIEEKRGFAPGEAFRYVVTGDSKGAYHYREASLEPIYYGRRSRLLDVLARQMGLTSDQIEAIGEMIAGNGDLGPLISGSMDLDNIDNVYRLAYHMGLVRSGESALQLARSIWVHDRELMVTNSAVGLLEEWTAVRERLYSYLLLNPEEFSAKCMLTQAIERARKNGLEIPWHYTDGQLVEKLQGPTGVVGDANPYRGQPSGALRIRAEAGEIVSRLMLGELFGCLAIFSSAKLDAHEVLSNSETRAAVERRVEDVIRPEKTASVGPLTSQTSQAIRGTQGISYDVETGLLRVSVDLDARVRDALKSTVLQPHAALLDDLWSKAHARFERFGIRNPLVALHSIRDVNKTRRSVNVRLASGEMRTVGSRTSRVLIGVFFENPSLHLNCMRAVVQPRRLSELISAVRDQLADALGDQALQELPLYDEAAS